MKQAPQKPMNQPPDGDGLYGTLMSHYDNHNNLVWSSVQTLLFVHVAVIGGSWAAKGWSYWLASAATMLGMWVTISLWLYGRKVRADRDANCQIMNELAERLLRNALPGTHDKIRLVTKVRPRASVVLWANLLFFGLVDLVLCLAYVAEACHN